MKSENLASSLISASICIVISVVTLHETLWEFRPNEAVYSAGLCFSVLVFTMGVGFALAGFGIIPISRRGRDKK